MWRRGEHVMFLIKRRKYLSVDPMEKNSMRTKIVDDNTHMQEAKVNYLKASSFITFSAKIRTTLSE